MSDNMSYDPTAYLALIDLFRSNRKTFCGRTYVWMGGRAETGISTRGRPFSMDKST